MSDPIEHVDFPLAPGDTLVVSVHVRYANGEEREMGSLEWLAQSPPADIEAPPDAFAIGNGIMRDHFCKCDECKPMKLPGHLQTVAALATKAGQAFQANAAYRAQEAANPRTAPHGLFGPNGKQVGHA